MNFAYCMYTTQGDYVCQTSQDQPTVETFYANPAPKTCSPLSGNMQKIQNNIMSACYGSSNKFNNSISCRSSIGNWANEACGTKGVCILSNVPRPPSAARINNCPSNVETIANNALSIMQTKYQSFPKQQCFDSLYSELFQCGAPKT